MQNDTNLATPIRGFFDHFMVAQRGLSGHTVLAYRDTMKLFLRFVAEQCRKPCTELTVEDVSVQMVTKFTDHLVNVRKNSARTRNARLAAIHSFFRYLATTDPRYWDQCRRVLGVPFKRVGHRVPQYLEREEVLSIFQNIDGQKPLDLRDEAILRLLYNTGMRASELVGMNINHIRFSRPCHARIHGKGHKERTCPIWQETLKCLKRYVEARHLQFTDTEPLFVSLRGERLSRFGLRHMVGQRASAAAKTCSTLISRRVTPHTFRHTTAMHLLQSGTDFNMIRSWLGHSSVETTHSYAEIDLEMKRKTLRSCERLLPKSGKHGPAWKRDPDVLDWLSSL